jgi:hypothetical protein
MGHVVLLGDSIFDNARYVPDRPPVIEQVRRSLPTGWTATLVAVDGHVASDVGSQLPRVPGSATHLFVSVGGNDALGESGILRHAVASVAEALAILNDVQAQFRTDYQEMLRLVLELDRPTTLCTIYEAIPGLEPEARTALGIFNDVILRSAFLGGLPVIDLRTVCTLASDFSHVSPIEPSVTGGAKISRLIGQVATVHDFSRRQTSVYS